MMLLYHLLSRKECPNCNRLMRRAELDRHVKKHDVGRSQYRTETFEYLFGSIDVTFRRTKTGEWIAVESSALKAALGKSYALRALIEERRKELAAPDAPPKFTKRPVRDAAPLAQLTPA